ncbi:MAG: hypothetical protein AABY07_05470, partial [Nanoarchaeota archaeon]
QIDLEPSEIVRIRSGEFSESEVARINEARKILMENGFETEVNLLRSPKHQQELLLSHYSGNVLAKTRPLLRHGFSRESVQLLGDNLVIGSKPLPGKGTIKPYIQLNKVTDSVDPVINNKVKLEIGRDRFVYEDGKVIQGVTIDEDYVEFIGYHFTSKQAASDIINSAKFNIGDVDTYVYFIESGWFSGKTESEIRHVLGASASEKVVVAKVRYPLDKIWIKAEKGNPLKIAVDGDIGSFDLIKRKGKLMEIKSLFEL